MTFRKKSFYTAIILLMMLSVLLAACGGKGASPSVNTPAEGNTADQAGQQAANNSKSESEEFRTYKTGKGDVQIPAHPKRIVTDYYGGELLAVGANVVGVEPSTFKNPFLKDLLKEAKDVGAPINVEKTLELKPDLIVVMYDESYEALSKIAPTLHIPFGTATNIQDTVKLFGDIVGAPDKAQDFMAKFDQKAAEGRARLKGIVDENATFGLFELVEPGDLWIFGDNAGRGGQAVYNALGYKMPHQNSKEDQTLKLSLEALPDYAPDYMFITTYDPDNKGQARKMIQDSAVWNGLSAVKNNRVFFNDFDTYYRYDPIAVMGQIDLIADMLTKRHEENSEQK